MLTTRCWSFKDLGEDMKTWNSWRDEWADDLNSHWYKNYKALHVLLCCLIESLGLDASQIREMEGRRCQGIWRKEGSIKKRWVAVMSPYKFTSKTHSLSTEDLEKNFIDWLIYLSTPREHFTINRKWARKSWIISRKSEENEQKIWMIFLVAIVLKRLCSGFRVHI